MAHHFRDAIAADDVALAEIYGHYVSTTVVTFDIVEVTPEIMTAKRVAVEESGLPFIVAVDAHRTARSRTADRHPRSDCRDLG